MPVSDLATAVGEPVDDEFVNECWDQATVMVGTYIYNSALVEITDPPVPELIIDRSIFECASELYHRRNAPNGVAQFATFDGAPVRVARDPMVGAYPILNRYLVVGL